nr:immunoglobulin light chain junction region [Macaca mulatta]MOX18102.1 immunoglobulin light chain junction region [Macaca mulatta]MOX19531.1 immunoglobulin light chain junction region [Macaca mulatta]MOX19854.1 immunoglobulin light chain junction region [Macaca mulatta]MOX20957.1 immunoglobulin light chain junction region [Macaca mulatta]
AYYCQVWDSSSDVWLF